MTYSIDPTRKAAADKLLQQINPFAKPPYVNTQDIWSGVFDLEIINQKVSDTIFQALKEIKNGQYPTTSIIVTAKGQGTGKSNMVGRIWRRLQAEESGLFILLNKFEANQLDSIESTLQAYLSSSFSHQGGSGVSQWQELASLMLDSISKPGGAYHNNPKGRIRQLTQGYDKDPKKTQIVLDKCVKLYLRAKPVNDPYLVRAIFLTLIDSESKYAYKWLAGKELSDSKAPELKLPTKSDDSFDVCVEVLKIVGFYKELILCFDELDALNFNSAGQHISIVVVNLIKDLFQHLDRGLILSFMQRATWTERVQKGVHPIALHKATAHGEPLTLEPLNAESAVQVVEFYLSKTYQDHQVIPPHPLYPFQENKIRDIGRNKYAVRELLTWCRENYMTAVEGGTISLDHIVKTAFDQEMQGIEDTHLDDSQLIASALFYSLSKLVGLTIDDVTITEVTEHVKNKSKDKYVQFKIIGKDRGNPISIGVFVMQGDSGKTLAAGLRKLLNKDTFKLTRGCLVRSRNKTIKKYNYNTYIIPLTSEAEGGEYVDLKPEEIKPLLALYGVYNTRLDYDVTEEQIQDFVTVKGEELGLGVHNKLIQEILSDPSNEAPDLEYEPETDLDNDPLIKDSDPENLETIDEFFN